MTMTQIEIDAARAAIRQSRAHDETNEILRALQGIDWEQRRYELAKAAMQGMLAEYAADYELVARHAVRYADALINELKKKEQ